jgi:ATP-binding cassette subfamily B protein
VELRVQIAPLNSVFLAVVHAGVPVVIAAGSYWLFSGRLDVGVLIVFLVLVLRVYQPLIEVAEHSEILRIADASLQRVAAVLDVPEQSQPAAPPALERFDVELDAVRFSYEPGVPVLSGVSLTAPERSMTAIVGPSGAGKTTIFNLVARFWDADGGTVRIGGHDVRELSTEQIFEAVGVVFQDVYLFNATLSENIAFGRPDATREAVVAAARAARCHEFISALPAGYDTVVSEGGHTLSGGERQRISIARAILKDAPIVLLDEATAALDPTNEKLVAQALAALVADKTVLVIAHRFPTIRAADQIVALDGGRVVETGTHDELIAAGGLYARFWRERERAQGWRLTRERSAAAAPTDQPAQETA